MQKQIELIPTNFDRVAFVSVANNLGSTPVEFSGRKSDQVVPMSRAASPVILSNRRRETSQYFGSNSQP